MRRLIFQHPHPVVEWGLALLLALAGILSQAPHKPQSLFNYDQPRYLSIAHGVVSAGVFGDGRQAATGTARPTSVVVPGDAVAPLYPGLVAAVALADPVLRRAASCVAVAPDDDAIRACPPGLGLLVPVQVALALATLLVTWRIALAVTGNAAAGWTALAVAAFGTGQYATYAWTAMTEALVVPLLAFVLLALVRLTQVRGMAVLRWAAAGGLALGLAALTRPEFAYEGWAILACGLALLVFRGTRGLGWGLLVLAGFAGLAVLPWMLRNQALFGHAGLTQGYGAFILAQRVAYQAMTGTEWLADWVYALPAFGPALARKLFGAAQVARLGWEERPDTFYMVGNTAMVAELLRAAPQPDTQFGYLLRTYVLPDLPWWAAVTLVMAWKGLWIRKFIGLPGVPALAVLIVGAMRRPGQPRSAATLAMALPSLFMLGFYAAVSVSTPRYNLGLVPCYAVAIGAFAGPWLVRMSQRVRSWMTTPNAMTAGLSGAAGGRDRD